MNRRVAASRRFGIAELDRKLVELDKKVQRKIVRKATNAGLNVLAKGIRQRINQASISPQLKRALKGTVRKSFKRSKIRDSLEAKAGFGIGKRKPPKRSGKNSGGVGISGRNVHWFALGTKQRIVKTRGPYMLRFARPSGQIAAIRVVSETIRRDGLNAVAELQKIALTAIEAEVNRLR